jgi:hypothetical protein
MPSRQLYQHFQALPRQAIRTGPGSSLRPDAASPPAHRAKTGRVDRKVQSGISQVNEFPQRLVVAQPQVHDTSECVRSDGRDRQRGCSHVRGTHRPFSTSLRVAEAALCRTSKNVVSDVE